MTQLTVYRTDTWATLEQSRDARRITRELRAIGVGYAHWPVEPGVSRDASADDVLTQCRAALATFRAVRSLHTMDVVRVDTHTPDLAQLRAAFRDEHTHTLPEARYFAHGGGTFGFHAGLRVWSLICSAGDWIEVPAGLGHWFDLGEDPSLIAVRLFSDPSGWVPQYTGSDIAAQAARLTA